MALQLLDPAAHTTLHCHFDDICRSNLYPGDLAKHLFARGVITEHMMEEANTDSAPKSLRHLVQAIMHSGSKEGFVEFLDFIQRDVSTRWLANRPLPIACEDVMKYIFRHIYVFGKPPGGN